MTTRRPQSKKTPVILRGTAKEAAPADMVVSEPAAKEAETLELITEEAPELERAADAAGFVMAAVLDAPTPEVMSAAEAWRSRTLRLWSDNTQAWLDLAAAIGAAPTPGNIAQLQAQLDIALKELERLSKSK